MNNMVEFAKRLREKRDEMGLTQTQLAKSVGVSVQTISSYEKTGEKGKTPTLDNAVKIAEVLGVSLGWLTGTEQQREKTQTFQTAGDVARAIVSLCEIARGEINSVEIVRYDAAGYPREITVPAVSFDSECINKFLGHWESMKGLYEKETFTEELYRHFLSDRFHSLDEIHIEKDGMLPIYDLDELPF